MTSKEAVLELIKLLKENHYEIVNKDVEVKTIKGYPLDRIIKDLEVLEIFKNSRIDIDQLALFFSIERDDKASYELYREITPWVHITFKEFVLLKEWWLEKEN